METKEVRYIPDMGTRMPNEVNSSQKKPGSEQCYGIVDGGADTGLCGAGWCIEEYTNRTVTVVGVLEETMKSEMPLPIASCLSKVQVGEEDYVLI